MRLILVEDDEMLGEAVPRHLSRGGFADDWVQSGKDFSEAVRGHHYDFVVLNLGLPDCDGEELQVRRKNQVLTRAQIEEALYGWGEEVESNAIEVYVHMLRRKFSTDLIHPIRGVGHQLAPARMYA